MALGDRIKEARKSKHLTQKELAALIDAKHNSISNWENNQNKPDPDTIELICGALDVSPTWLLQGDKREKNTISIEDVTEISLLRAYRNLNDTGKKKAMERIEELTYIPMYSNTDYLQSKAAHKRTDIEHTVEGDKHDDELMNDDSIWND